MIIEIVKEYIQKHKTLFYSYLLICCLSYIIKVFITSIAYSKLFNKNANIPIIIRNICFIWISICVIYVIKVRLETEIFSEFLSFIRFKMFDFYLNVNEYNFNDTCISSDVSKLLELTRNVRDLFYWACQTLLPIIILIFIMNLYFLVKFPKIGALNVVGNFIMAYICFQQAPKVIKTSVEKENQYLKIMDKIDENFNNIMNIYLNDKVKDTLENNKELDKEYKKNYIKQSRDIEMFITMLKTATYSISLASLFLFYKTTSLEQFINALLMYTFYISAFENMSEDIPYYTIIYGSIQNTENFYSKKKIERPSYTKNLEDFKGNVDFINISFHYPIVEKEENEKKEENDIPKNIVQDFSLSVKRGERITIFAKSGSGKTTIMKLLLAFYKPQKGSILLDGKNINDISPHHIRNKINYVNQRTLLFQDTILNNMKYGNNKTDEQIISILGKYNLLSVFSKTSDPSVLSTTQVLKNGTNISMGMQKVIFLVRGLLKEDAIVYVLDEPLTSIDPSTRQNVLHFIDEQTKDKTLIIISHDKEVGTIPNMKTIYIGKQDE